MQHNHLQNRRPHLLLAGGFMAAICLLLTGPARVSAQAASPKDPSEELYKLGFTFQAPATCSNVNCHGAPAGQVKKNKSREAKTDSYTLWSADGTPDAPADQHHIAFKDLTSASGKAIGAKMKIPIANPAVDAKCISCHSLNPPKDLLKPVKAGDPILKVSDAVSCNACHGPSGTWTALHDKDADAAISWSTKEQAALGGHEQLLKKYGFYNTRPLIERAERCVSCHLAIDPEMIAAGHRTPMFELNWFSVTYNNKHWNDPHDAKDPLAPMFEARLWAAGQVASLHEALEQLATRAETAGTPDADIYNAYNQAMSHYTVFSPAFSTGAIKGNMAQVTAQVTATRAVLQAKDKRADLAKAAHAAAAEVAKLDDAVRAYEPTAASSLKLAQAIAGTPMAATLGAFGIEQQRDAIFAQYDAYANAAGNPPAAATAALAVVQKLFVDPSGKVIRAEKFPVADYTKTLDEVKKAIAG
jgi:predicted CxxxxCH...CXXCH cytochrome family protein